MVPEPSVGGAPELPDRRIGEPLLTARGLTVAPATGAEVVVRGDLTLHTGELVALLGPTGAGKTTFARALCGGADLRSGMIELDGEPLAPRLRRRPPAARRAVRWVPQDALDALNPAVPVDVAIRRHLVGPRRERADRLRILLTDLGLAASDVDRLPEAMSGGQRHRAVLAKALATEPRVLVCDEVTAALDNATTAEVLSTLAGRAARGAAVLLITHDTELAHRCDRVLHVVDGEIVELDP